MLVAWEKERKILRLSKIIEAIIEDRDNRDRALFFIHFRLLTRKGQRCQLSHVDCWLRSFLKIKDNELPGGINGQLVFV